ncbi:RNA polymerase sigma-70 factor, ECF subfamily [Anaerosphaera aminiphila DSM 21120]|uniref:RNA polymerase sigma-70 factor, ECF subfamily n=1 Tax=Anaerosphaera aminiphila DSM 21120 TaxID=1120995 RepID=A0A1M5UMU8_9FIRM|nr:sigma-70 family RNA polymerase sigma factor [Anaerosphaera aminiphila]SHH64188.1 RNA polymerase sigma-70 factor, ECF subfamily [Anaerosphaera aminiphila DSM 21120]
MEKNEIFRELMLNREDKLYRIAFSYMKNEADSLDVVQDTLLKALLKFDLLEDYTYFDTWVIRILINTCKDHLRKKREYISYEDEIEVESIETEKEETMDLINLLDKLPADERELLYCRYFEDLRVREIAEKLSLKEGTVKSKLSRILSKLRKKVKEENYEIR